MGTRARDTLKNSIVLTVSQVQHGNGEPPPWEKPGQLAVLVEGGRPRPNPPCPNPPNLRGFRNVLTRLAQAISTAHARPTHHTTGVRTGSQGKTGKHLGVPLAAPSKKDVACAAVVPSLL